MIALGAMGAALGVRGLRENVTAVPRPIDGGRPIDSGGYGLVRRPIYASFLTAALGWALATASPAALLGAALLAAFFDLKARREEA
jgi:protein-S-isoprenylcysteine O-methyltransferase Ste14